jgi:hypothetical protein
MRTKEDILKEIKEFGFPDNEVAISADDFFDNDNYSESCIGVNIYPDPPPNEVFYQTFKDLIASRKAEKIFVRISDVDEPEEWFFSDTVYIISSLKEKELKESINILRPDEVNEEWMYGKPVNVDDIKEGQKVYSVFWD